MWIIMTDPAMNAMGMLFTLCDAKPGGILGPQSPFPRISVNGAWIHKSITLHIRQIWARERRNKNASRLKSNANME